MRSRYTTLKKFFKVFEMCSENVFKPYSMLIEQILSFPKSFLHLNFHPSDFSDCSEPIWVYCAPLCQAMSHSQERIGHWLVWAGLWTGASPARPLIECSVTGA